MLNVGSPMMRAPQQQEQQGVNTSPQDAEALMRMIMMQQQSQGPQTTVSPNQSMAPPPPQSRIGQPAYPNGYGGGGIQTGPQFDQMSQPGLATMAPRNNVAPQTDNRALQNMGPSSPLMSAYKVPPMLAR